MIAFCYNQREDAKQNVNISFTFALLSLFIYCITVLIRIG